MTLDAFTPRNSRVNVENVSIESQTLASFPTVLPAMLEYLPGEGAKVTLSDRKVVEIMKARDNLCITREWLPSSMKGDSSSAHLGSYSPPWRTNHPVKEDGVYRNDCYPDVCFITPHRRCSGNVLTAFCQKMVASSPGSRTALQYCPVSDDLQLLHSEPLPHTDIKGLRRHYCSLVSTVSARER